MKYKGKGQTMHKKFFLVFACVLLICGYGAQVKACDNNNDSLEEIYSEQVHASGADELIDELDPDTQEKLKILGVESIDWHELANLRMEKVFYAIIESLRASFPEPAKTSAYIIGVILLTAICMSLKQPSSQKSLEGVIDVIGCLCICVNALYPIIAFVSKTVNVIQKASKFILCYIPVMSGIMIATGQTASAASYNVVMLSACEIISQISANLLAPFLCILLTIAVVSSISARLNLSGVYDLFHSSTKWVLGFAMTIFTGLLSIQSVVGASADTSSSKTVKFVISSFVPVVGSALGDAFGAVQSCVKLLKSGVGAFGILGAGALFLPIVTEAFAWIIVLNVCSCIGRIFELGKISKLLANTSKVLSLLLSIVFCCMTVLIVSTVIILVVGNHSS